MTLADKPLRKGRVLIYRTPLLVRIAHWINAICLAFLLTSGLQIFNAHPALYWGQASDFEHPWLRIDSEDGPNGPVGFLEVAGLRATTTGVLGVSSDQNGQMRQRAFPGWIILPPYQDLGSGRRWHFFFAWIFAISGAIYVAYTVLSGRFWRALLPRGRELKHIGSSIWDHVRLRFDHGEAARNYNVLQKLSYLVVLFGLLPLMIATGLSMSPTMNAAAPWLLDLFGGRQSARSIHFICAAGLVLFFIVHIVMVVLAGPFNEMRSIVTGWFVIKPKAPREAEVAP